MLTLVTVIYGSSPLYRTELFGSVLSILKLRQQADTRVLVYTDRPLDNFSLPVSERIISAEDWRTWTLGTDLTHLVKLHLIRRTLEESNHPVIYFDTDTIFLVPPEQLAARLSPNIALMHADEGPISGHEVWSGICSWLGAGRDVHGVTLSGDSVMHNSGIVGVVPEHMAALNKSIEIANTLQTVDPIFSLDQFSTGNALLQQCKVLTCKSEVLHYWGWRREFVRHAIEEFRSRSSCNTGDELIEICKTFEPAALMQLPVMHWLDRLRSRLISMRRGLNSDGRFAWVAIYSAMRHAARDPAIANYWFTIHLNMLRTERLRAKLNPILDEQFAEKHALCSGWLNTSNALALTELRSISSSTTMAGHAT